MKTSDILSGIARRAATATPIEPSFTLSPVEGEVRDFSTLTWSLRNEFPFLLSGNGEIGDADLAKFDGLFAWLVNELRGFRHDTSDSEGRLLDILTVAAALESDAELWGELAQSVPNVSPQLIDGIARVFTDIRPNGRVLLAGLRLDPDQISAVLDSVARKDWKSIEWTMDRLRDMLWLPLKTHAAAALHQYSRPRLNFLLERADDMFEVAAYVLHAPVPQALTLAVASQNWTFKFWSFHKSARYAAAGKSCYPVEWEALLTQAANEPEEWVRWLAVLNEYPARYPHIQPALGSVLAGASSEALDAYVASISLAGDFARHDLAESLSVFRSKAPLSVRQRLWTAAFVRWKAWDFGCDDQMRSLLKVERSSFDYPVMGYLTECLSAEVRAYMAAELATRAAAIERTWHSYVTPAMSERFKLISTHQLLAHAEAVAAGVADWLASDPLYRPSWEDGTDYRSLKFDLGIGKATF